MKKKLLGILVCMLMIIPALATTVTANPEPEFKIRAVDEGLIVGIISLVENNGDTAAEDVEWSIKFESGTILLPLGGVKSGSFKNLPAGESKSIFSGPVFGMGILQPAKVTITVSASNADTVEESVNVIIFLFYTFVLKDE